MLFYRVAEDDNIVYIAQGACPSQPTQHVVHELLEHRWGCFQAEKHAFVMIQPAVGEKSRFPPVLLCNFNLMVSACRVEVAEYLLAR
jgi:hypothetical protein